MTAKAPTARRVVRPPPEDDDDDDLDFRDDLADEVAAAPRPAPVAAPAPSLAPPAPTPPPVAAPPPPAAQEKPVPQTQRIEEEDDDDLEDDELDGVDIDDGDDDDLEEDEEGEEEDEDQEEDEPAPRARRPPALPQIPRARAPRRPRVPRPDTAPPEQINRSAVSRQGVSQLVESDTSDFFASMSEMEFGSNKFKISIMRVTPEFVDGVKAAGYLEAINRPITPEEIKQKYGGGTYRVMIYGPHARTGKNCCLAQRTIEIAGEAESPGGGVSKRRKDAPPEPVGLDLTKIILAEKERDVLRAREDAKQMQKQLQETMSRSEGGIEKVLAAMMSMNNPGQLREEFREERRMQELKMQQEREDRRRDQENLARQHERSLQESRMQHERSIEMMKMEQARIASEAQAAQQRNEVFYKEQMALLDRQNGEKERRAEEHTKMMMQMMENNRSQQFAQMQQVETMKTQFLTETIKDMKRSDDKNGIKQLLETKQLLDALSGNGGDGKEGWEKILEKAGEVAPGIMAAANMYMNRGTTVPQMQPPRIQAGSVAVVDLPSQPALAAPVVAVPAPRKRRTPSTPTLLRRRPAAPPEAPVPPAPVAEPDPAPAAPVPELQADEPNNLTEITIPDTTMEAEPAIKLLVQNIDFALQKGYSVQRVYDEVITKYPRGIIELLKMTSTEMIIETLSKLAPASWLINTPFGTLMIEDLFPLIKEM